MPPVTSATAPFKSIVSLPSYKCAVASPPRYFFWHLAAPSVWTSDVVSYPNNPCKRLDANSFSVIARSECDEAIHLSACGDVDCFASLAMTTPIVPAARNARVLQEQHPRKTEGAGKAGATIAPAVSCKEHEVVTTGTPNEPAFPAQWCYGL